MINQNNFKCNILVISSMVNDQINFNNEKVAKEDFFVLKYERASFDNPSAGLYHFSKQIMAAKKIVKMSIGPKK